MEWLRKQMCLIDHFTKAMFSTAMGIARQITQW